jgi:NADPH2:quinone reductase
MPSRSSRRPSFLKGLTVFYLLRKTYEIKPDEAFLFHAAAGGVGLIACQWAKALGAKLIGTVGSAQKAQRALQAGAWQVINYREESIVERVKEITGGKKSASCMTRWVKTPGKTRSIACSAAA